jgi:hypothetical protein
MSENHHSDAGGTARELDFAAFISYTTNPDYQLSRRVESFLESFHTQVRSSGLDIPPLQVCRDGSDFGATGIAAGVADAEATIDRLLESHLARSRNLVILCSKRTAQSRYVALEIEWFLKNRGGDHVLLAVSEGRDPIGQPEEVFPPAIIAAGLHYKPWYDLRGFRGRQAKSWMKVRAPDDELARLAAHLAGDTSGRLVPSWRREMRRRARRLRLIAGAVVLVLGLTGAYALWQGGESSRAQTRAAAGDLLFAAEANLARDPQLALLLGIAAAGRSLDADGFIDADVESLLMRAILASPRRLGVRESIDELAWSPDGRLIAAGDNDGGVTVFDVASGNTITFQSGQEWIEALDWTDDGTKLASGGRDGTVFVRNTRSWAAERIIQFGESVNAVDWRPRTLLLAVALAVGDSSRVEVYDYLAGQSVLAVPGFNVAWSPAGDRLAVTGFDGRFRLVSPDGQVLSDRAGHHRVANEMRWTASGPRVATSSVDDTVMVWNGVTGERLAALPSDFPLSVAWSPDGSLLASGSAGGTVTTWSGATYELLLQIGGSQTLTGDVIAGSGPQNYVNDLEWSPDGTQLALADRGAGFSGAGEVIIYPTGILLARSPEDWLAIARSLVTRPFTDEECLQFFLTEQCPEIERGD